MDLDTEKTNTTYDELIKKATVCLNDQMFSDLTDLCRQAIGIDQNRCEAYFLLSVAAYVLDDLGRAVELALKGHELSPDCKEGNDIIAHLQAHAGKLEESIFYAKLDSIGESNPLLVGIQVSGLDDLAKAINESQDVSYRFDAMQAFNEERYEDAVLSFEKELRLRNGDSLMFRQFGTSLYEIGEARRGIAALHGAIHMEPDSAENYLVLGNGYLKIGDREMMRACFQRALQLSDTDTSTDTSILSGISFCRASVEGKWPEFDKAITKWHKNHQPEDTGNHGDGGDSPEEGMIRVGYLLDRATQCDAMRLIESVLWNYDRNTTQIFVYSMDVPNDPVPERLNGLVMIWTDIRNISDHVVCNTIQSHKLDILIDATLTPEGQRPGLIAMKPCPLVYRWLGPQEGMFANIYDGVLPAATKTGLSEPVTLDSKQMPSVDGNSPVQTRNHITFCTTADISNITPDVVMAWAEILRRVPDSILTLGNVYKITPEIESRLMELFAVAGIVGRVQFDVMECNDEEGLIVTRLKFLVQADIYLDTFPVTGFIELADALWSGVPVIAMKAPKKGDLRASLVLNAAGYPELIAKDASSYIDLAVSMASTVTGDVDWRGNMHNKVKESILFQTGAWKEMHSKLMAKLVKKSK